MSGDAVIRCIIRHSDDKIAESGFNKFKLQQLFGLVISLNVEMFVICYIQDAIYVILTYTMKILPKKRRSEENCFGFVNLTVLKNIVRDGEIFRHN